MKKFLLLIFSFVFVLSVWAQDRVITGKVTSTEDGTALPGVNVVVKGTTNGTVTDAEGKYSLSVPATGASLVFSFIGLKTTEVPVGDRTTVDFSMTSDIQQLSEVVVVGYGSQVKQDLTGNIASVKGEALKGVPVPSFEQALQGRAAGVFVEAGNGKLGQGIKVRIRGSSSVSASNEPLYVVDGVPITSQNLSSSTAATNPLVDINTNDIESVDILKDASAAAIYGSRAANGVVLITTKRGKSGKTNFNLGYFIGTSSPTRKREWLNTAEYVELFTEARQNSEDLRISRPELDIPNPGTTTQLTNRFNRYGAAPSTQASGVPYASWATPGAPGYVDTNWEDQAYNKDAGISQLDLSINGGNEKTKFFISGGYTNQKGILVANSLDRINGRVNLDHQATDKLSLGINFSLSRTINKRLSDDNAFSTPMQIIALTPFTPVIDPRINLPSGALDLATGAPSTNFPLYYNPLLNKEYGSRPTTVFRNLGSAYGAYKMTGELTLRSEFGYDLLFQNEEQYFGKETARNQGTPNGFGFNASTQVFNFNTNNFLRYTKTFNEVHNLEAIAGMSYQESNTKFNSVTGQQFPSNAYKKVTSAASITAGSSTETAFSFLSYFARANYKFKNRYLLALSGRVDGSSRFGSDKRYGFFPAASVGWILSEESFFEGAKNFVDFLKLRVSYGITGNAEIGNFPSVGLFSGDAGYAGIPGQRPSQLANPNLKWEETAQTDIGIDFGFLNSRITGQLDYYEKNTSDLLLNVNLPGNSGYRTQTRNVGSLENKGFEVVINSENLVGNFKWSTSLNYAKNTNKILNLDKQIITGNFLSRTQESEPIGIFFGQKYAGVDPTNGDALYEIVNPDGSISMTNNYNSATLQKIGNPNPNFIAGITNNFSYKGIELSFLFQGVFGNKVYNGGGKYMSANGDFFDNQSRDQLNRWRKPGDITDIPQARLNSGNGTGESSRYLLDATYVRLKTVTLSYNLPSSIISRLRVNKFRVYASAQNLLTITDYKSWDPEVNSDSGAVNANGTPNNTNQGIDFYSAPQAKTITFGVNISF
jgi:TonB-dependent starch-binding outer membrane protein SusC